MGRTQAALFPLGLPTPLPLVHRGNIRVKLEAVPLLLKNPCTVPIQAPGNQVPDPEDQGARRRRNPGGSSGSQFPGDRLCHLDRSPTSPAVKPLAAGKAMACCVSGAGTRGAAASLQGHKGHATSSRGVAQNPALRPSSTVALGNVRTPRVGPRDTPTPACLQDPMCKARLHPKGPAGQTPCCVSEA